MEILLVPQIQVRGGGGLAASPRATGCGIYNRRHRWREAHLLGDGASRLHFPCGRRAELTGLSRVAGYEPSGSASWEEGGLGISVGVEEEEQAFSVRVRKKGSGVFWTSEEALTTRFFSRTALFLCIAA